MLFINVVNNHYIFKFVLINYSFIYSFIDHYSKIKGVFFAPKKDYGSTSILFYYLLFSNKLLLFIFIYKKIK